MVYAVDQGFTVDRLYWRISNPNASAVTVG